MKLILMLILKKFCYISELLRNRMKVKITLALYRWMIVI